MKINLKQARRIEREIGTQLDENTGRFGGQISVSIYENLEDRVGTVQTQLLDALNKVKQLTKIRFSIRKSIETVNETGGLNSLMNREAELRSLMKSLANQSTALSDENLAIMVARHAAAKVANEKGTVVQSRYGESTDSITMSEVLRPDTLSALRGEVKQIQRELVSVVDKLATLNGSCDIEVSDADVKTLEGLDIVV